MKDLVIVGVGGTSRDMLETIESINQKERRWNLLGFVDDQPSLKGSEVYGYPVLGETSLVLGSALKTAQVAIGVANDRNLLVRQLIRDRLQLSPARCPTLIHPSAVVSTRTRLGAGTVILSGVFCGGNAVIGNHAVILQNTVIGHDACIGDFVSISANVSIAGSVVIGAGTYVGIGSSILPNRKVGREAVIGIGSVVMRDVEDYSVVVGNPARVVGSRQNNHREVGFSAIAPCPQPTDQV